MSEEKKRVSVLDYIYQYKDHLGNIRLSYSDINNDGSITASSEIKEENNYYPFGLKHKGYNTQINGRHHKFGFGNKEEQDELGLGWIDITARNYDPALGRWMNLDPLAEKMRRHSPYNYAFDNPIFFTDPDGMAPQDCCDNLKGFISTIVDNAFSTNISSRLDTGTQEFASGARSGNATSLVIGVALMIDGSANIAAGGAGLVTSGALAVSGVGTAASPVTAAASVTLLAKGSVELAVGGNMMSNAINNMKNDTSGNSKKKTKTKKTEAQKTEAQVKRQEKVKHKSNASKAKKQKHTDPRSGGNTGSNRNNNKGAKNKKFKKKVNPNKYGN